MTKAELELAKMGSKDAGRKALEKKIGTLGRKTIEAFHELDYQKDLVGLREKPSDAKKPEEIDINKEIREKIRAKEILELARDMKILRDTGQGDSRQYRSALKRFQEVARNFREDLGSLDIAQMKAAYIHVILKLRTTRDIMREISKISKGGEDVELFKKAISILENERGKLKKQLGEALDLEGKDLSKKLTEMVNPSLSLRRALEMAERNMNEAASKYKNAEQSLSLLKEETGDKYQQATEKVETFEKEYQQTMQEYFRASQNVAKDELSFEEDRLKSALFEIGGKKSKQEARRDIENYISATKKFREKSSLQNISGAIETVKKGSVFDSFKISEKAPLGHIDRMEAQRVAEQLNGLYNDLARKIPAKTPRAEQMELAKDILLTFDSANEAPTGYGKTSVLMVLLMEGRRRLYPGRYGKSVAVLSDSPRALETFNKLKGDLKALGYEKDDIILVTEHDLYSADTLTRIDNAKFVFTDVSTLSFAEVTTKGGPEGARRLAKEISDRLLTRADIVQDEIHMAALNNTPHSLGIGSVPVDPKFKEFGSRVSKKMNDLKIKGDDFFVLNSDGDRTLEAEYQELVLRAIIKDYLRDDSYKLNLKDDRGDYLTLEKMRERIGAVKNEKGIAGNAEFMEKIDRLAGDWEYIVNAMHKTALVSNWNEGAGQKYAEVNGKLVPVNNGYSAEHMHFRDPAIRVALEFRHAAETGGRYKVNLDNIEISPEALHVTWSRVAAKARQQGSNITGLTATLRGVKDVLAYGFDLTSQLHLDPLYKYGKGGVNPITSAMGILDFTAGVESIDFVDGGKDIVLIQGSHVGDTEARKTIQEKAKDAGIYSMVQDNNKIFLRTPEGKNIELTETDAMWLLARYVNPGDKALRLTEGERRQASQALSELKESLKNKGGINLDDITRVVAYINRPGGMATDWKMGGNVEGYVFLDARTSDTTAHQIYGRFREIFGTKEVYPEMKVFVVGDKIGEISAADLRSMQAIRGVSERQKAQHDVAYNNLIQGMTNFLEGFQERAAPGSAERSSLEKMVIKWQNEASLHSRIGDDPSSSVDVLNGVRARALRFLEETVEKAPLSRENRSLLNEEMNLLRANQKGVNPGTETLTPLEEIRLSRNGGAYGASSVSEAVRFLNAKLTAADLPQKVFYGGNEAAMAYQNLETLYRSFAGKELSPEEALQLRALVETGDSRDFGGSLELAKFLTPILASSKNQEASLVIQALTSLSNLMAASPAVFNNIPNFLSLNINTNGGSWAGLSDPERVTLAVTLLGTIPGFENLSSDARDLVTSVLNPRATYDNLKTIQQNYFMLSPLDPTMARRAPLDVLLSPGRKGLERFIRDSRRNLWSDAKDHLFGITSSRPLYSFDSQAWSGVKKAFHALEYYPGFLDRRTDKFAQRIVSVDASPLLKDAAISILERWVGARMLARDEVNQDGLDWEDVFANLLTPSKWQTHVQPLRKALGVKLPVSRLWRGNTDKDQHQWFKELVKGAKKEGSDENVKVSRLIAELELTTRLSIDGPDLMTKRKFLGLLRKHDLLKKDEDLKGEKLNYLALLGIAPTKNWEKNLLRGTTTLWADPSRASEKEKSEILSPRLLKIKGKIEEIEKEMKELGNKKIKAGESLDKSADRERREMLNRRWNAWESAWWEKQENLSEETLTRMAGTKIALNSRFSPGFDEGLLGVEYTAFPILKKLHEDSPVLRLLNVNMDRVGVAEKNLDMKRPEISAIALKYIPVIARSLGSSEEDIKNKFYSEDGSLRIKFVMGRNMVRSGQARSEVGPAGGGFELRLNLASFVRNPYGMDEVVEYFDIPHELLHVGLDRFYDQNKDKIISPEIEKRWDQTFGAGVMKKLLDENRKLRVPLGLAGNGSYNEFLASGGGLRLLVGNGASPRTKRFVIENLTGKKFSSQEVYAMDFDASSQTIENARSDLKVDKKAEALKFEREKLADISAADREIAGKLEKHVKDNNMLVLFSDDEYDQAAEQVGAEKGTGGWSVEYDKDINIVNTKGQIKQVSLKAGQFFTTESKAGNGTVFANTIFHEANGGSVRKFVSGMS
ncbi:MAG: hypothetical protein HY210_01090, partial [Candidatus Omnitrophica bacterium]|nr:hypothetical protein [Candidatus Omnitrophota bacterium]